MTLWTTFCPSKICWELTFAQTKGKQPTSDWLANTQIIKQSLQLLKTAGISGIRLVIFPSEITQNGKTFNWKPIDTILAICKEKKVTVVFCIGPFQYPYYPGIYLPPHLLLQVGDTEKPLDANSVLRHFGDAFLRMQLERYGKHPEIVGFHLANEWPDRQAVAGKEEIKALISEDFMINAVSLIKSLTAKPIYFNTNIDASDKKTFTNTFANMFTILADQAKLGFDIYPSQETWFKVPLQKLRRLFQPYYRSFRNSQKKFPTCEIYFAEVEAQPWGNGQSWYRIITDASAPNHKILSYARDSLHKTQKKYIALTDCNMVSLWGADFWLTTHFMGITWPLKQIRSIFP